MKSQRISKSILSFLIFLVTYIIEWYRLPKKCIVELVAHPDNSPPIISNIEYYYESVKRSYYELERFRYELQSKDIDKVIMFYEP